MLSLSGIIPFKKIHLSVRDRLDNYCCYAYNKTEERINRWSVFISQAKIDRSKGGEHYKGGYKVYTEKIGKEPHPGRAFSKHGVTPVLVAHPLPA